MATGPHWHYEVEQTGCPRYVSKVSAEGRTLCSFAEVFPYDDAYEAMDELLDIANRAIGYEPEPEALAAVPA